MTEARPRVFVRDDGLIGVVAQVLGYPVSPDQFVIDLLASGLNWVWVSAPLNRRGDRADGFSGPTALDGASSGSLVEELTTADEDGDLPSSILLSFNARPEALTKSDFFYWADGLDFLVGPALAAVSRIGDDRFTYIFFSSSTDGVVAPILVRWGINLSTVKRRRYGSMRLASFRHQIENLRIASLRASTGKSRLP